MHFLLYRRFFYFCLLQVSIDASVNTTGIVHDELHLQILFLLYGKLCQDSKYTLRLALNGRRDAAETYVPSLVYREAESMKLSFFRCGSILSFHLNMLCVLAVLTSEC